MESNSHDKNRFFLVLERVTPFFETIQWIKALRAPRDKEKPDFGEEVDSSVHDAAKIGF